MIPRNRLDVSYADFLYGFWKSVFSNSNSLATEEIRRRYSDPGFVMPCLSVRSGLDLVLQNLNWPAGSEILISAVTISDMPRIIREHGFVPVPVDIDPRTLTLEWGSLEKAVTENTKAVLFAHLFGTQANLSPLVSFCAQRGLLLLEDCAQAFSGQDFQGTPGADVSFFSFGPIKTATALGGAILTFKTPSLGDECEQYQRRFYPVQPRTQYLLRLSKFLGLKIASHAPVFTILWRVLGWMGRDFDAFLSRSLKSFPGEGFFVKLRQAPSVPLLALLNRRIGRFPRRTIGRRMAAAHRFLEEVPNWPYPGDEAHRHTHWIFAATVEHPLAVSAELQKRGFDATVHASNMKVVEMEGEPKAARTPQASSLIRRLIFLPVYPGVSGRKLKQLAGILEEVTRERSR